MININRPTIKLCKHVFNIINCILLLFQFSLVDKVLLMYGGDHIHYGNIVGKLEGEIEFRFS